MSKCVDTLQNATVVIEGIPWATEEHVAIARKLLIDKGAFDIMEMLGIHD